MSLLRLASRALGSASAAASSSGGFALQALWSGCVSPACASTVLGAASTSTVRAASSLGKKSPELYARQAAAGGVLDMVGRSAIEENQRVVELGPERPDLVEKYLSLTNANRQETRKATTREIIEEFRKSEYDTGSTEVQIALLTEKINSVSDKHFKKHRKDHSSRRGFTMWLTRRRDLLQYLRKRDFDSYTRLLDRLHLRDTYFKTERLMKYRIGTGLKYTGGPDPLKSE